MNQFRVGYTISPLAEGISQDEESAAGFDVTTVVLFAHVENTDRVVPLDKKNLVEIQQWITERYFTDRLANIQVYTPSIIGG